MENMKFEEFLRVSRKKMCLSQEELARMTGFTVRAISLWETGKRKISLENAMIVVKALGCELCIKKGGDEDAKNTTKS